MSRRQPATIGASFACPQCHNELIEVVGVWGICNQCQGRTYYLNDPSLRRISTLASEGETPLPILPESTPSLPMPPPSIPRARSRSGYRRGSGHARLRLSRTAASETPALETPEPSSSLRSSPIQPSDRQFRSSRRKIQVIEEEDANADRQTLTDVESDSPRPRLPETKTTVEDAARSSIVKKRQLGASDAQELQSGIVEDFRSRTPEIASAQALLSMRRGGSEAPVMPTSMTSSAPFQPPFARMADHGEGLILTDDTSLPASILNAQASRFETLMSQPAPSETANDPNQALLTHAVHIRRTLDYNTRRLHGAIRQFRRAVRGDADKEQIHNLRHSLERQIRGTERAINSVLRRTPRHMTGRAGDDQDVQGNEDADMEEDEE